MAQERFDIPVLHEIVDALHRHQSRIEIGKQFKNDRIYGEFHMISSCHFSIFQRKKTVKKGRSRERPRSGPQKKQVPKDLRPAQRW